MQQQAFHPDDESNDKSSESESLSDIEGNQTHTAKGPQMPKAIPPKGQKSCSHCTMFNPLWAKKCKTCDRAFPKYKKPQKQNKPKQNIART
jgi:hypothetical protein